MAFSVVYDSTDGNGVNIYTVTSDFNGPLTTTLRIKEPDSPAGGQPHRKLLIMPVEAFLGTSFGDGLEEARILDIQDTYNCTLIAPSFNLEPWIADSPTETEAMYETFLCTELVPWINSNIAAGPIWLVGFSKSGLGSLGLIGRNPSLFSKAAAWDFPENGNLSGDAGIIYGDVDGVIAWAPLAQAAAWAPPFQTFNRLWIGDNPGGHSGPPLVDVAYTGEGILHDYETISGSHDWESGWLEPAVAALAAMGEAGGLRSLLAPWIGGASAVPDAVGGGYRSLLAPWIGGASAVPDAAGGGYRSLLAPWIGGAASPVTPPATSGGYRSLLAPWIGGAASPVPPPITEGGYRSFFAFWMGGAGVVSDTPVVSTSSRFMNEITTTTLRYRNFNVPKRYPGGEFVPVRKRYQNSGTTGAHRIGSGTVNRPPPLPTPPPVKPLFISKSPGVQVQGHRIGAGTKKAAPLPTPQPQKPSVAFSPTIQSHRLGSGTTKPPTLPPPPEKPKVAPSPPVQGHKIGANTAKPPPLPSTPTGPRVGNVYSSGRSTPGHRIGSGGSTPTPNNRWRRR